jgi:superfamily II DNA/RNA helicase
MTTFSSLNLPAFLTEKLAALELSLPTPVQAQAIPVAMEGKDVLASSQTGSGKTIAYLAPLISHLMKNPQHKALVLLPTREIAHQVKEVLERLSGRSKEISAVLLIGGEPIVRQFSQLKGNPNLVIGTPGRICDHLERRSLNLNHTNFLVLDEVDRMLDMGFIQPLNQICKALSPERQTLMFSATLSHVAEKIAAQYLDNPTRITITSAPQDAPKITQDVVRTETGEKMPALLRQLKEHEGSVLIFVKTKRGAKDLALKLTKYNHSVGAIHGDLQQSKRTRIMRDFRLEHSRIMVATDIAARGLDVPHINLVINYDLPVCPEDYVHRIGRTGRAGAVGKALSFVGPEDGSRWRAIERLLNPGAQSSISSKSMGRTRQAGEGKKYQSSQKKPWHKEGPASEGGRSNFAPKKPWHKEGPASEGGRSNFAAKKPWHKEGPASEGGRSNFAAKKPWHKEGPASEGGRSNFSAKKPWHKEGPASEGGRSNFAAKKPWHKEGPASEGGRSNFAAKKPWHKEGPASEGGRSSFGAKKSWHKEGPASEGGRSSFGAKKSWHKEGPASEGGRSNFAAKKPWNKEGPSRENNTSQPKNFSQNKKGGSPFLQRTSRQGSLQGRS